MQDNIDTIISNSLLVTKSNASDNIRTIIKQIKKVIFDNKELLLITNNIDKKNNNGFILDFNIIYNIFSNIEKENIIYGDVILSKKDDDKKIIYGTQIMDIGNVVVINDGNPYVIIEMILRNILALNTTIFVNNGFMYGTNKLIIELVQSVLEKLEMSKYLIQMYITENIEDVLNKYANIDLVVCIGNHSLQQLVLEKSKVKTITSGYEHFDIYVEDKTHTSFIEKIINTGLDFEIYVNSNLEYDKFDSILVDDIDEAIAKINYNGSRYSSAIFTSSNLNASKFIKEVRSSIVTVNTSPTIERIIDIKQSDLVLEKTIIYPLNFKFSTDENNINIQI